MSVAAVAGLAIGRALGASFGRLVLAAGAGFVARGVLDDALIDEGLSDLVGNQLARVAERATRG